MDAWQLPEGIDELIGDEALKFEGLRRKFIDLYVDKGFELVIPPMVEHLESLLPNAKSLDTKTFKFVDPASGRMLGARVDVTTQIARIDANRAGNKVAKYCYINAILQTQADDFYSSRSPIQAGAELYGTDDVAADIEIIELMLDGLDLLAIKPVVLSLGNVAIFNAIVELESFTDEQIQELRQIFQRRSTPDLEMFIQQYNSKYADKFLALMKLEGGREILDEALIIFADFANAKLVIQDLLLIGKLLNHRNVEIIYDLGEIKSYEYHNGLVFSTYNVGYSKALTQGGRYNSLGDIFGKSRAATGFSFDLKFLSQVK